MHYLVKFVIILFVCQTSVCDQMLSSPAFGSCKDLVDIDSFVKACARDLCQCANSSDSFCLCGTVSEYSRQCIHAGGKPGEWRTEQFCREYHSHTPFESRASWDEVSSSN